MNKHLCGNLYDENNRNRNIRKNRIVKIQNTWYLEILPYGERNDYYAIKYCPYCGKKLV